MSVEITHPDKLLFPADGLTKADIAGYYEAVSEWMLPHIRNRPMSLLRFPDGIDGHGFFHKNVPDYFPALRQARGGREARRHGGARGGLQHRDAASTSSARTRSRRTCWLSRADRLRQPDRIVFDLDPAPGRRLRRGAPRRPAHRRPAARDRPRAVRPGDRLEGHPRLDSVAPARHVRRRPPLRARGGGGARRSLPRRADTGVPQVRARRAHPRGHHAQQLRPDGGTAVCRPAARRSARGHPDRLGGAVGLEAARRSLERRPAS